jgi:type II secretory pathway component GspD/PulD (secretin)
MKTALAAALAIAAVCARAQADEPATPPVQTVEQTGLVTVQSKGDDVRNVLFDLFTQSNKSFVLEPSVRHTLYLSLRGVPFEEALELVCATAGLAAELDNGIYFVSKRKAAPQPVAEPARIVRRLTETDLAAPVTTKLTLVDLRTLLSELSRQTGIAIEVHESVPSVKVDAVFHQTPLSKALGVLTKAAKLEYSLTDHYSVAVRRAASAQASAPGS